MCAHHNTGVGESFLKGTVCFQIISVHFLKKIFSSLFIIHTYFFNVGCLTLSGCVIIFFYNIQQ